MNIKVFNNKFYRFKFFFLIVQVWNLKGCIVSDSKRNLSFLIFPAELAGFSKEVEQIDQVSYFD